MSSETEKKIYMCGDSHSVELYGFLKDKISIFKFQTLGGYGLCSFVDPHTCRPATEVFKKNFENYFQAVEEDSIILISAFDPDVRLGLGKRFNLFESDVYENFYQYYGEALEKIVELSSAEKIILLDFYPLVPNAAMQNISNKKRIIARGLMIKAIQDLNYPTVKLLTVHKDGIIHGDQGKLLDRLMCRDNVHFNLTYKLNDGKVIGDFLVEKIQEALDEW